MTVLHLCIDMQVWCVPDGKFSPEDWALMKQSIQRLADGLKEREIPTIWIGYGGPEKFFGTLEQLRAYYHKDNIDFAKTTYMIDFPLQPDDLIGLKRESSADFVPGLRKYLVEHNIDTLILSGFSEGCMGYSDGTYKLLTNGCCINETARSFCDGFKIIVAAEATNAALRNYYTLPYPSERDLPLPPSLAVRQWLFDEWGVGVLPIDDIFAGMDQKRPTLSPHRKTAPQLTM